MGESTVEQLVEALWERFHREVSISYRPEPPENPLPWGVMVEGDVGGYGGSNVIDALEHRLEGEPPEKDSGWGTEAR